MKYTIEKVSNMVFITDSCGQVWNSWDEYDFTERKLKDAMKKIQNCYNCEVAFDRKF